MKIIQEIEYTVTAKAVLRDGKFSLTVTVGAPYAGNRTASIVVEEFTEKTRKAAQAALEAAISEAIVDAPGKAAAVAHEAHLIAMNRGEV